MSTLKALGAVVLGGSAIYKQVGWDESSVEGISTCNAWFLKTRDLYTNGLCLGVQGQNLDGMKKFGRVHGNRAPGGGYSEEFEEQALSMLATGKLNQMACCYCSSS